MRSNYFPDDKNRYHVGSAAVYKADIMGSPSTTFPKSKLALWYHTARYELSAKMLTALCVPCRDRSPVGAWIEISTAGAAPLLALHREWCLALVKPAHASTTAFAHLCCQLVPRSSVEGFSSPVVGGGEQVLSVEAVDAGEAGRMPSPQQTTGPPRDSLRVPIQYRSEPGFAASAPFDSEDTRSDNLVRDAPRMLT